MILACTAFKILVLLVILAGIIGLVFCAYLLIMVWRDIVKTREYNNDTFRKTRGRNIDV